MSNENKKSGIAAAFKTKHFRAGSYSMVAGVIVIIIAILVNIFVANVPTKYTQIDITSNSLYSISEQTEAMLSSLNEEINIYWIVRRGYEDTVVESILNQYADMSDYVTVTKKDPEISPTFVSQYTDGAFYDNSVVVVKGDKYRYVDYNSMYDLEYDYYTGQYYATGFAGESAITSAIDYVIRDTLPKMYTLSGHGELELSPSYVDSVQKQNIVIEDLPLITMDAVPEDADIILIYSPESDISVNEKDMLIDYLNNGGKLIVFGDVLEYGLLLTNLNEILAYYGVNVMDGFAIESNEGYYAFGTPYYLLPNLCPHEITSVIDENGYYVMLALSLGYEIGEAPRDSVMVTPLLTTSGSAYLKRFDASTLDKEPEDYTGTIVLSLAITENLPNGEQANIVWSGSSTIVNDEFNAMVSGGNEDFFLNSIAWAYGDTDDTKITIHSKSFEFTYLTIPESTATVMKVIVVGILPALYLIFGISIFVRRKRN